MKTVTPRKKRSIKEIDPTMIMKNLPKRKGVLGLQIIMTTTTGIYHIVWNWFNWN